MEKRRLPGRQVYFCNDPGIRPRQLARFQKGGSRFIPRREALGASRCTRITGLLGARQEIEERRQVGGRGEVLVVGHRRGRHGGGIEAFAARFLLLLVSVPGIRSALVLFEVEEHDQQGNSDNRHQGCHAAPPDAPGGMFFRPRAV